jgi:uncharacterized protein
MIDFWAKTSGTWINILTVAIGTFLGLTLKNRLTQKMQLIITQGIGLITIWIGLSMANTINQVKAGNLAGVILGLLAMVIGGIIGEILEIEEKLTGIGNYLKKQFRGQGRFTEGFVASSLLFCVGPMTLIGCLNNGLTGDNTLLTIKATMDGIVSIALANIYGVGVGCSILVLLIYQGGLSLAAGAIAVNLTNPESSPYILLTTGVGGLIILGIGLNLLEITKIRVASLLPAIALSPLVYHLANYF